MLSLSLQVAIAAASAASVAALPPHDARTSLLARQSNDQPIKVTDYSAYPDPARWSQAAYCNVQSGDNVNNANVIKTFGDGSDTPYAYVAWHEASNRVVVSHEGESVLASHWTSFWCSSGLCRDGPEQIPVD